MTCDRLYQMRMLKSKVAMGMKARGNIRKMTSKGGAYKKAEQAGYSANALPRMQKGEPMVAKAIPEQEKEQVFNFHHPSASSSYPIPQLSHLSSNLDPTATTQIHSPFSISASSLSGFGQKCERSPTGKLTVIRISAAIMTTVI